MKGQFFLVSGLIVVVVLLLIKSSLNLAQIIENKKYLETGLERKEISNLRGSLIKTVELSYNKNETLNIENYLVYVRKRLSSRAIEFKGIAIGSTFKNVSTGSNNLNVSFFNFLGETVENMNLTFEGSIQNFINIADNSSVNAIFTFTGSNTNFNLSVSYTTKSESKSFNVTIPVELGKSKFVGYFDLRMKSLRGENRDEFSKVVEIV